MEEERTIEVYACGNNAWRQLEINPEARIPLSNSNIRQSFKTTTQVSYAQDEPEDFHQFQKILTLVDEEISGIWSAFNWTVVQTSNYFYFAGQVDEGLLVPNLDLIATTGNDMLQTEEDFFSLVTQANLHSSEQSKLKQIVANQTSFTALDEDGIVWTWGDARFPGNLGREVDVENPFSTPTILTTLLPSDINSRVTKIASGGFITAALTSTHDIYVWGSPDPASSSSMIPELSGDPTPLIIKDPINPHEEFDFLDIGVGLKHVILLTTDHRIFVIGGNANSQLGFGSERGIAADWKQVCVCPGNRYVISVAAGGNASFAVVEVRGAGLG